MHAAAAFAVNHPLLILLGYVLLSAGIIVALHGLFYGEEETHVEVVEVVDIWAGFDNARRGWEVRHKLEQAEDVAVFKCPAVSEYTGVISR